jgi:hypothetical protein
MNYVQASVILIVILAVATMIASFFVFSNIRSNFQGVVTDSAPSIIAAQDLGKAIQDADASAANYQLASRVDLTSPDYDSQKLKIYGLEGLRNKSWQTFEARVQQVNNALFQARKNITYPGEADAIAVVSERFLEYVARINIMRYELDQGHREAALSAYKSAHDLLVGNLGNAKLDDKGRSDEELSKLNGWTDLKPAANCTVTRPLLGIEGNLQKLSVINKCQLEQARQAASTTLTFHTALVTALAALLLLALAFLAFRYASITHRIINPGFGLALVGSAVLLVVLFQSLNKAGDDYGTVAQDSFASIESAARVAQYAYDANADESRLLLSPESNALDSTNLALTSEVRRAFSTATLTENFDKKRDQIQNELKNAWANVTYTSEERKALCQITQNTSAVATTGGACPAGSNFNFDEFLKFDKDIRDNFKSGLLAPAISINTAKSDDTFSKFDAALTELSNVNARHFDQTACNAIGKTEFGANCTETGYVPFLQNGVLVFFPLIALAAIGGYWYIRREL